MNGIEYECSILTESLSCFYLHANKEKNHEKELCFRNTKALRFSSLRFDLSLVLKFSVVLKHLSASTEDIGIPSKALYSFSKI